jgi:hypothetical protein
MNYPSQSKNITTFTLADLAAFFESGWFLRPNAKDWVFVATTQPQIQGTSPVTMFLKIFSSARSRFPRINAILFLNFTQQARHKFSAESHDTWLLNFELPLLFHEWSNNWNNHFN